MARRSEADMPAEWQRRVVEAAARTIAENAALLTELDAAIGDGDHGSNMKRGFDAAAAIADQLAEQAPGPALQRLGMTLVGKVGGASGPLYGSLCAAMGKALGEEPIAARRLAAAFTAGVDAVKARGKSDAGEKTMLDVLVPVAEALRQAASDGAASPAALGPRLRATAEAALQSTRDMKATKGRAAYLGERSLGHLDPGAQSSCLLVSAMCRLYEEHG